MWIYLVDGFAGMYPIRKHLTNIACINDIDRLRGQVELDCKQSDVASFIRAEKLDFLEDFYYNPRKYGLCINKVKPIYWFK